MEVHPPDGPDAAFPGVLGEGLVDPVRELDQGVSGVAPQRHRGGAGVVLLTGHGHREVARSDDAGDHADTLAFVLEPGPLLDVRLGVADVAGGVAALDGGALEARLPEGIAQDVALRVGGIVGGVAELAAEGVAAEAAEEAALLVDPGGDVDREVAGMRALGEGPGHFQAVDDTHRPVEPAALGLGVGVRADEQRAARPGRTAEHRADAVDARFQPCFAHPLAQPTARLHVDGSERLAHHAGAAGAEAAQSVEVAEQAIRIDPDLGWIHGRAFCNRSRPSVDNLRCGERVPGVGAELDTCGLAASNYRLPERDLEDRASCRVPLSWCEARRSPPACPPLIPDNPADRTGELLPWKIKSSEGHWKPPEIERTGPASVDRWRRPGSGEL